MASEEFFGRMKDSAIFINTCRGGVQDEAALIAALRDGVIAGAGLSASGGWPEVCHQSFMPPSLAIHSGRLVS